MTVAKIASELAKREGKKSQARIGDIREVLKLLVEMEVEALLAPSDSPLQALTDRAFKKYQKKSK